MGIRIWDQRLQLCSIWLFLQKAPTVGKENLPDVGMKNSYCQDAPFIAVHAQPAPPSLRVAVTSRSDSAAEAALCSGIVTSPFSFMTSSDDVIAGDDDSIWLASMLA